MTFDTVALGASVALAMALLAVAYAVSTSRSAHREAIARRLRPRSTPSEVAVVPRGAPTLGKALSRGLRPFARIATPTNDAEGSRLRLRLAHAGIRRDHGVQAFLASKVILAIVTVAGFVTYNARVVEPVQNALLVGVVLCAVAFYAPNAWLSSRIQTRQTAIRRGLPDTLDLLVTCVEAGLGLDSALLRVAGEIERAYAILAEELELTFLEVKAGMPRVDSFRRLAERTGIDDLKQLAATLTQTEMFGTSVATALRVQAEGMRVRRMQRAEEQAAMVGVKMSLPLVFNILPSLFAVIIGPAAVNIIEILLPQLGK
jgi:tight adherence protein C